MSADEQNRKNGVWGPKTAAVREAEQGRIAALAAEQPASKPQPPVIEGLSLEQQEAARRGYIERLERYARERALIAWSEQPPITPDEARRMILGDDS